MRRSTDRLTLLALLAALLLGGAAPAVRPADGHPPADPSDPTGLVRAGADAPAALHPSLGVRTAAPKAESDRSGGPGGAPRAREVALGGGQCGSPGLHGAVVLSADRDRDFRTPQALVRAGLSRWSTGRPPPVRSV